MTERRRDTRTKPLEGNAASVHPWFVGCVRRRPCAVAQPAVANPTTPRQRWQAFFRITPRVSDPAIERLVRLWSDPHSAQWDCGLRKMTGLGVAPRREATAAGISPERNPFRCGAIEGRLPSLPRQKWTQPSYHVRTGCPVSVGAGWRAARDTASQKLLTLTKRVWWQSVPFRETACGAALWCGKGSGATWTPILMAR